jgi:hypothetical protein
VIPVNHHLAKRKYVRGSCPQDDRVRNGMAASARPAQNGNRDGWLGTWAQRQVHYNPQQQPSLPTHIPGTPQPSERSARKARSAAAAKSQAQQQPEGSTTAGGGGSSGVDAAAAGPRRSIEEASQAAEEVQGESPGPAGHPEESDTLADDEEGLRQAAWRWHFNRRWAQEQARQMDPEYGRQVCADKAATAQLCALNSMLLLSSCLSTFTFILSCKMMSLIMYHKRQ